MKNKLAWVYNLNGVPATIAEHVVHDFNLKRQEMPKLKRKVSWAKMLRKPMYLQKRIYYEKNKSGRHRRFR